MKLAMCQMHMEDNISVNTDRSLKALKAAAKEKADLILFPELQFSRFFPQYQGLDMKDFSMKAEELLPIQEACRENNIMAAPNIYLRENNHLYDATFLIDKRGNILGC